MPSTDQYFDAREMQMIHNMFRREFHLAAGLVRGVIGGDDDRTDTVISHLEFITNALHLHHGLEDHRVWPVLLERCPDEKPDIIQTMDQHAAIDAAVLEVTESLAAWRRNAAPGPRDWLAADLDQLLPILLHHMAFEEEIVVPLMERCITQAEWNQFIQAEAAELPQTDMPLEFGMMMYEGDPEIVDVILSNMPEELREYIQHTARQSFADHARRVHGTATPLRSSEIRTRAR